MKILSTPKYKERAESFKAEINHYDTPTLATELLEQLALTKNLNFMQL